MPPPHEGGSYRCNSEGRCHAYYFNNGLAELESILSWYEPDGRINFIQEFHQGFPWLYCRHHRTFERNSPPEPIQPCLILPEQMTPMLSG